ncbi:IS200/IS605 family accessory protein TnpB-related protein [Thermus thermophilus]|uniref:IS200/IS605 family accessory protein TnpB-related protein n=1 Tax=Thermus thermophilus TaxID=274 RepID=UPI001C76838B|nr:IS200/IS605 family accessory protein TnpB-related protein [Thermus thermophilus]BCZ90412.1 transposase [Thermus thermophilus]
MKAKPKVTRKRTSRKRTKAFTGAQALLVFPFGEDQKATLDLMRRFSAGVRYAYNRLLEGESREELKRQDGPLCAFFRLNTRYADDAILKAQALLDSARERGEDPRKVVFGGRKLFETLKRGHLSGKPLKELKREWKEKRQGLLYSRGDKTKGGNLNLRLLVKDGTLGLRINLGDGSYAQALIQTKHPNLNALLKVFPWRGSNQRVYASLPYNVELSLKDGKVYATFTWEEEPAPLVATKENGVLGIDINADPYHLALALVGPDGNLKHHLTLSLEPVDRAPNKGAKELFLWKIAHEVVSLALEHGVAIATERLKHLRKSRRGDGSGRAFRRKQHRFAYASLLRKVHALARRKGVQVVEVNPQDTSTIGMLKYAPQLSLSKDVAAAYVIGRRALGFAEKLPRGYGKLLQDKSFRDHVQGFYASRVQELRAKRSAEPNRYLRRKLSQKLERAKRHLSLLSSLQGSPGSQREVTDGRNSPGVNPWRVRSCQELCVRVCVRGAYRS